MSKWCTNIHIRVWIIQYKDFLTASKITLHFYIFKNPPVHLCSSTLVRNAPVIGNTMPWLSDMLTPTCDPNRTPSIWSKEHEPTYFPIHYITVHNALTYFALVPWAGRNLVWVALESWWPFWHTRSGYLCQTLEQNDKFKTHGGCSQENWTLQNNFAIRPA